MRQGDTRNRILLPHKQKKADFITIQGNTYELS